MTADSRWNQEPCRGRATMPYYDAYKAVAFWDERVANDHFSDLNAWGTHSGESGSKSGDPGIDQETGRLLSTSICRNAGFNASAFVTDDLDREARPLSVFDIGADESA